MKDCKFAERLLRAALTLKNFISDPQYMRWEKISRISCTYRAAVTSNNPLAERKL